MAPAGANSFSDERTPYAVRSSTSAPARTDADVAAHEKSVRNTPYIVSTPPAVEARSAISAWLRQFEAALAGGDTGILAGLFAEECHYRDLLAFSWTIRPDAGADSVASFLIGAQASTQACDFVVADDRTAPGRVRRLGIEVFEGIFKFQTRLGRGHGVVRLLVSDPTRAWVLLTSLDECANGTNGIARMPVPPDLSDFAGDVMLAHGFRNGSAWRGKKALVIGTGNSGHDVDTTIIQRGSTTVVSIGPSARLNYTLCEEGNPLEDCDLIATATTYPLMIRFYQAGMNRMVELDNYLIAGLIARGFEYDIGDAGCSRLITGGEVGLLQYANIERLKDGTIKKADLSVLATGYYSPREVIRRLLGDEVANRIGQVWGIDSDGEMENMRKRTALDGLWFMGGGLTQCRVCSLYRALQIKAIEEGLISDETAPIKGRLPFDQKADAAHALGTALAMASLMSRTATVRPAAARRGRGPQAGCASGDQRGASWLVHRPVLLSTGCAVATGGGTRQAGAWGGRSWSTRRRVTRRRPPDGTMAVSDPGDQTDVRDRRPRMAPTPASAMPSRAREAGSGTSLTLLEFRERVSANGVLAVDAAEILKPPRVGAVEALSIWSPKSSVCATIALSLEFAPMSTMSFAVK